MRILSISRGDLSGPDPVNETQNKTRDEANTAMKSRMLLLLLLSVVANVDAAERTNVLLFTADDLHAQSLGVYGSKVRDLTPHLDRFAAQRLERLGTDRPRGGGRRENQRHKLEPVLDCPLHVTGHRSLRLAVHIGVLLAALHRIRLKPRSIELRQRCLVAGERVRLVVNTECRYAQFAGHFWLSRRGREIEVDKRTIPSLRGEG